MKMSSKEARPHPSTPAPGPSSSAPRLSLGVPWPHGPAVPYEPRQPPSPTPTLGLGFPCSGPSPPASNQPHARHIDGPRTGQAPVPESARVPVPASVAESAFIDCPCPCPAGKRSPALAGLSDLTVSPGGTAAKQQQRKPPTLFHTLPVLCDLPSAAPRGWQLSGEAVGAANAHPYREVPHKGPPLCAARSSLTCAYVVRLNRPSRSHPPAGARWRV